MDSPDNRAAHILVVEDDAAIREGLELNLSLDGHRTTVAGDGEAALAAIDAQAIDLVLLDVMLPGRNGFEVLRALRARGHRLPVILLTARTDEADKVRGLELGADDYVTKPFGLGELRARIRAALRRAAFVRAPVASVVRFGEVEIDRAAMRVRRAAREVALTAREFALLCHFVDHPQRVMTREDLLRDVWGGDLATVRTVDNFVMRLRAKLERDAAAPALFVTVRGSGYRFSPDPAGDPPA